MLVRPASAAPVASLARATARGRGSTPRRCAAGVRGYLRRAPSWATSAAKIAAWRSSQSASANRSTARRRAAAREPLTVGQHARHRRRERLRRGRLVAVVAVGVRDADARVVADELDGPAARRVRDGQAARHRLDHDRRARVVDLRVQQDVRAPEDVRRSRLRVAARRSRRARSSPSRRERRPGSETSLPLTRSRASGCSSRTCRNDSRPSSSRYACV